MYRHSDPTANMALGSINREFSHLEKKAKKICKLYEEGLLSEDDLAKAQSQFTGIFRHILNHALKESKK
jgi:hypothetical protein